MEWSHRSRLTPVVFLAALLSVAVPAAAEFVLLVTPTEVLAVDVSDDEVVSRYGIPPAVGTSVSGIAEGAGSFILVDKGGRTLWSVDPSFGMPTAFAELEGVDPEGIARHGDRYVVNGQASMVPPDTLVVVDLGGAVVERFAVPAEVTTLKDITSDGTNLWAIDTSDNKTTLWRIDPATGAFDLSHDLTSELTLTFAVAWNDATDTLWVFRSAQGNDIVGYTVDRDTGAVAEGLRVTKAAPGFAFAAVFTDAVVPVGEVSWGALKRRFAGANAR